MIEFAYTAAIVRAKTLYGRDTSELDEKPYAVVSVFRGCVGFRLPTTIDLYFAKYDDAAETAHRMNTELGIDPKEAAYLAIEAFRKTY